MSDFVINNVTITGRPDRIEEIRKLLEADENVFNFEKLLPMPKSLKLVSGSITRFAVEYANLEKDSLERKEFLKDFDFPYELGEEYFINKLESAEDLERLGKMYLENQRKYGAETWYEWRNENWGTKWNAANASITERAEDGTKISYSFETAWAPPIPVFFELSKQFPDVRICVASHLEYNPDDVEYFVFENEEG